MAVRISEGDFVPVEICLNNRPTKEFFVSAKDFAHRDPTTGLRAFRKLIEALGYTWRDPFPRRGVYPTKKMNLEDEPDLVAFRHSELHRVANPSPDQFRKYAGVIHTAARRFWMHNTTLCRDYMMDIDDLQSYARVWLCNYLGLFALPPERDTNDDNAKMFHRYLQQRFVELASIWTRKGKSILAHADDAHIGATGYPFDWNWYRNGTKKMGWKTSLESDGRAAAFYQSAPQRTDILYHRRHCVLDVSTPTARRRSATALLDAKLGELPHDRLVQVLNETAASWRCDPGARKTARLYLQRHQSKCSVCSPPQENQQAAGIQPGSAAVQL